jgi:hypothetical protein
MRQYTMNLAGHNWISSGCRAFTYASFRLASTRRSESGFDVDLDVLVADELDRFLEEYIRVDLDDRIAKSGAGEVTSGVSMLMSAAGS